MIADTKHSQLRDYLTQVYNFSGREGLPRITHSLIAQKLEDGESTIQKFLKGTTKKPLKLLNNFIRIYPFEYNCWPQNAFTIGRQLVLADVCHFLGIQALVRPEPSPIFAANINLTPILAAAPAVETTPAVRTPEQILVKTKFPRAEKAAVIIGYRGHQSDKDGEGMLYDHMAIQNACARVTKVSYSTDLLAANAGLLFSRAINAHTAQLPYGPLNTQERRQPSAASASYDGGLLVIPGRVKKLEFEPVRTNHEERIIKDALNRGQPIVAICAGVWRLVEQLHIFANPTGAIPHDLLLDVKDHNYGGGMLRLGGGGTNVVFNVQIHKISILRGSVLETAMKENVRDQVPLQTTVNSVHWRAINPSRLPSHVQVSALSVQDPNILLKTRQGEFYSPDQNTVEAIESVCGAPILGLQWHPEGYNRNDRADLNAHLHRNALNYMALAGDAYAAKVKMMTELKRKHLPIG